MQLRNNYFTWEAIRWYIVVSYRRFSPHSRTHIVVLNCTRVGPTAPMAATAIVRLCLYVGIFCPENLLYNVSAAEICLYFCSGFYFFRGGFCHRCWLAPFNGPNQHPVWRCGFLVETTRNKWPVIFPHGIRVEQATWNLCAKSVQYIYIYIIRLISRIPIKYNGMPFYT